MEVIITTKSKKFWNLLCFIVGRDLNYLGAKVYGYGRSERNDLGYLQGYYTKSHLQDFLKELDYVVNVMPSTKETEGLLNGGLLENCSGNNKNKILH